MLNLNRKYFCSSTGKEKNNFIDLLFIRKNIIMLKKKFKFHKNDSLYLPA
jgi:hypothetical protein